MDMVLVEQIVSVLFQAVEAGIQYGPAILSDLKLAYSLAKSGTALTPEQQTAADSAVAAVHQQLQAQVASDAAEDGQQNS